MAIANAIDANEPGIQGMTSGGVWNGTPVTNHAVIIGGSTPNTLTNVGPSPTAGQIFQSGGLLTDPGFSNATYPSISGVSGKVLISDGTNIVLSTPTFPNASVTAGKFIQSDGTNWIASTPTLPTTAGTSGNVLTSDGTNWVSSSLTVPIGSLQYFPTSNNTTYPNPNWLLCDGSAVSQATYPTLFQRVGLINEAGTNFTRNLTATITQSQNSIVFGNGLFVSAGNGGTIYTSTDGITWTSRTSGTASVIRSIDYGGGLYLYGGTGGVVGSSTDAITWTVRTSGTASNIQSVAYGGGIYLYTGTGGVLSTSTDTITWNARTSGTTSTNNTIIFLNSLYLYGGQNIIGTSTDGITWVANNANITSSMVSIWFNNSKYYASGTNLRITSTDGTTWTSVRAQNQSTGLGSANPAGNVIKVNNVFLLTGSNSNSTSTDGENFKYQQSRGNLDGLQTAGAAYDGLNTVVATGSSGSSWTSSVYTYNTATSFKLPTQFFYNSNTQDNLFSNLYIKAL
jgi:hypothetical protein